MLCNFYYIVNYSTLVILLLISTFTIYLITSYYNIILQPLFVIDYNNYILLYITSYHFLLALNTILYCIILTHYILKLIYLSINIITYLFHV